MGFKEYLWFAIGGFIALLIKISKETGKSAKQVLYLILVAVFMSMIIAPAISEYFNLSVRMSTGLSGFLVLFGNIIIDVIEKRLPSKLNDKIDSL